MLPHVLRQCPCLAGEADVMTRIGMTGAHTAFFQSPEIVVLIDTGDELCLT